MRIKLIALDMDGTTLTADHQSISPRTKKALTDAIAKGIHIVPSTGSEAHSTFAITKTEKAREKM